MNHSATLLALLSAGALTFTAACSSETEAAPPNSADASSQGAQASDEDVAVATDPVPSALVGRSAARLELIEKEDWIQSYDFLSENVQEYQPMGDYLKGTQDNHYVNKAEPTLLATDGELGYVQVVVDWTPTHAEIQQANNLQGQDLTQELHLVETWRWEQGDWRFLRWQRGSDFRNENPKLFRRDAGEDKDAGEGK